MDVPHGIYHSNVPQEVDDRSISAPPVLELTAKVSQIVYPHTPQRAYISPRCPVHPRCKSDRSGPRPLRVDTARVTTASLLGRRFSPIGRHWRTSAAMTCTKNSMRVLRYLHSSMAGTERRCRGREGAPRERVQG